jgi:hypothetical protein
MRRYCTEVNSTDLFLFRVLNILSIKTDRVREGGIKRREEVFSFLLGSLPALMQRAQVGFLAHGSRIFSRIAPCRSN